MLNDLSVWVSIVSALAAWVAAIFAYRSNLIAKRSLTLAEEQAKDRRPHLVPYLVDGFVRSFTDWKNSLYAFSVSLGNRSDADNALANIELKLVYYKPNQPITTLLLPHDPGLRSRLGAGDTVAITRPQNIGAHQTIAGWVFFELDELLLDGVLIDSYEIRFTDSHGLQSKLEPIIIREVVDEKEMAKP